MKKLILISLIVFASALNGYSQTKIEAKEAAKHMNETVMVFDKIAGGKYFENSQTTLLDVGAAHPNELFTIVIKGDDRKKFAAAPETDLLNKRVCITGKIIEYKGKPEIIVTEAAQLVFR